MAEFDNSLSYEKSVSLIPFSHLLSLCAENMNKENLFNLTISLFKGNAIFWVSAIFKR